MFTELGKFLLEFLKLAPRYLIAVAIFAAFFLFSPESLLKRLGVFDFTQSNRSWLGVALLASSALFGVGVLADMLKAVKRWWWKRKFFNRVTQRLHRLTEDEKQILRFYLAHNTRANTLSIEDGVVQGLVADGVIYRSAAVGNLLEGFAHNICDIAWDYLHVYPQLLEGSTNTYRTDKRGEWW